jgi:hypothetical protein
MFKKVQADQQTDIFAGNPGLRAVAIGEDQIAWVPVGLLSKNAQRVAQIQPLIEPDLEQSEPTQCRATGANDIYR